MQQLNTVIKEKEILRKQLEYNQKVMLNESFNHKKFESVYNKCKRVLEQEFDINERIKEKYSPLNKISLNQKQLEQITLKIDEYSDNDILQDDNYEANIDKNNADDKNIVCNEDERIQQIIKREQQKNTQLLNELNTYYK